MSEGKIAAAMVCVFFVATTAGTWAAWNSYITPAIAVVGSDEPDEQPRDVTAKAADPQAASLQAANQSTKGDRLAPVNQATLVNPAEPPALASAPMAYSLASVSTTAVEAEPLKLRTEPRVEARKPVATPTEKQKRAEQQKLLLDDAQIASLRTRLKLTPTQEEFWPAVEITLRDVVRAHARNSRKSHPHGVAPQIDVNSTEVQQLISAAVPLIMRLSEQQKHEVRQLARIIGLETVASKI